MWIGGTVGQKDSKHKDMKKAIPDGRYKPPHAVRLLSSCQAHSLKQDKPLYQYCHVLLLSGVCQTCGMHSSQSM